MGKKWKIWTFLYKCFFNHKIIFKMNKPENLDKQMRENTKEFKNYFNILKQSQYHRQCPPSIFIIFFVNFIVVLIIILIKYAF